MTLSAIANFLVLRLVRLSILKSSTDKLIRSFGLVLLVSLGIHLKHRKEEKQETQKYPKKKKNLDEISKLSLMVIPKNFDNGAKFDVVQIALRLFSQIIDHR